MTASNGPLIPSLNELRRKAREQLADGPVTPNYKGDVVTTIRLLNDALSTEIVCVLRYKHQYATARGVHSESVKQEFLKHAHEEQSHADRLAERINQLGGNPEMNPAIVGPRSATEYVEKEDLMEMIREDLVAERVAIEIYRSMIRYFGDQDPTTRRLLEDILVNEEEHANDMHDLLIAHQAHPLRGA
jgi:bacterioferritin